MTSKIKDTNMKIRTYFFFNDIINTKIFDPNEIKIDEKSYRNTLLYYLGYVTIKDLKCIKNDSVSPLYLIIS